MGKWIALLAALVAPLAWGAPMYTVPAPEAAPPGGIGHGPARVGQVLALSLDSATDGVWSELGDERIWQAELFADGARFLSLHFDLAQLPEGARLMLHGAGAERQGPYTRADVRDGQLWTALVHGESARLELRVPVTQAARLKLAEVHYGQRDPGSGIVLKSGSCNIDVVCSQGNGHEEAIRSTVLLVYPVGSGLIACSGLLVNNARDDRTPYLLTADHCEIDADNDESLQVYWQYERDACMTPHDHQAPDPQFSTTGAVWLADDPESDFTLLVLGEVAKPFVPPASFAPYWAGWDVTGSVPQNGVGVHHPSGHEKAISLFESPARAAQAGIDTDGDGLSDIVIDAWEVIWDQGTTEQGSSGSGLWNENERVVGLLSGGSASCSAQDQPDFYGRLDVGWQAGERCDGQLRFWLDPDGSGVTSMAGSDLADGAAQAAVPACNDGAPGPTPTPEPTSSPSPTPTPEPTSSPSPTPVPTATPAPTATPKPTATPGGGGGGSGGLGGLGLLLLLSMIIHRRFTRLS